MDEESTNKAIVKFWWLKFEKHVLAKVFITIRYFPYIEQDFCLQLKDWRTSILFFDYKDLRLYLPVVTHGNKN